MTVLLAMMALAQDRDDLPEFTYNVVDALLHGREVPRLTEERKPQGVYVTIEIGGEVVGCRGSLTATETDLEKQIVAAATEAALHDPRYGPVHLRGRSFRVTLTLVERLEQVGDARWVAASEGLVLTSGSHVGVVLPYEGKDPLVRLGWAYTKAGVPQGSAATLQRLVGGRWRFPEK
jgi:AMMECR1 domain-containing protein